MNAPNTGGEPVRYNDNASSPNAPPFGGALGQPADRQMPTGIAHSPAANGAPSLIDRLEKVGCTFGFFQAVWLLERHSSDARPVGQAEPLVNEEAIRFRVDLSMGFPSTDVHRIIRRVRQGTDRTLHVVETRFLGLYGVSSPLPSWYPQYVLQESTKPRDGDRDDGLPPINEDNSPVRSFLDLIHHRIHSFYYRAWLKYRYHAAFALSDRDEITGYMRLLAGLPFSHDPLTEDAQMLGLSPLRMLRYVGLLTQRPRSASSLEGLLRDYWPGLDVVVNQFLGRWLTLGENDMIRMGQANGELGVNAVIGEQVYDLRSTIGITCGPLTWTEFQDFLPDSTRFAQTRALIKLFLVDPMAVQLTLRIKAGEIPEARMGGDDGGAQLGRTSWIRAGPMPETRVTFDASWTDF